MKKTLLLFIFFITSCSSLNNVESIKKAFYDNENCSDMREFEIFQTLDDGALAFYVKMVVVLFIIKQYF